MHPVYGYLKLQKINDRNGANVATGQISGLSEIETELQIDSEIDYTFLVDQVCGHFLRCYIY